MRLPEWITKEGGLHHRLTISRRDARYYAKHRRWVALMRSLWLTQIGRNYGERCQQCGRAMDLKWWSPTPLWCELVTTTGGGCLCTSCYDALAEAAGLRVIWTPMVAGRYDAQGKLIPTTNHWLSDTRDWLMMGEPDPDCFTRPDHGVDIYPTQWPWARIKEVFADVTPPSSNTWGKQELPAQSKRPT